MHLPEVTKSTFPRIQPCAHKHIHYGITSENEQSGEKLKYNCLMNKVIFKERCWVKIYVKKVGNKNRYYSCLLHDMLKLPHYKAC